MRQSVSPTCRWAEADFEPLLFDAAALANDLPVCTCNPDEFAGIDGLKVLAVDPTPSRLQPLRRRSCSGPACAWSVADSAGPSPSWPNGSG